MFTKTFLRFNPSLDVLLTLTDLTVATPLSLRSPHTHYTPFQNGRFFEAFSAFHPKGVAIEKAHAPAHNLFQHGHLYPFICLPGVCLLARIR